MKLNILFEDNHLIIINKEPGTLVQSDISGEISLQDALKEYIKEKYHKPGNVYLGIVHRLDKPVSGITLFARTSKAASRMHSQFLAREPVKRYIALVENRPMDSSWHELTHNFKINDGYAEISPSETKGTKKAVLKYKKFCSNETHALLIVELETGRKHQIRIQLSDSGMPIAGDTEYGSSEATRDGSILLHAAYIKFLHPVKEETVEIFTGVPKRFLDRIDIDEGQLIKSIAEPT